MRMLPIILKNLFKKKATRNYPAEKREVFKDVRGELVNEISKCIFCKACSIKCPANCIEVDRENRVWHYDPMACVYCGICSAACPVKCLTHKSEYRKPTKKREKVALKGAKVSPKK